MTGVATRIKLFDAIDLTGDTPVVKTKSLQENITVVNIDNDPDAEDDFVSLERVKKCGVCSEEVAKYTCPGCALRTCRLACIRKHKRMTGCSGVRDKVEYVARKQFTNTHLLSDLRFLEEAARLADNARRDHKSKPLKKVAKRDKLLQKGAQKSGCKLFRMAKGMQRWKENHSFYNIKDQTLLWTIKLIFNEVKEEVFLRPPETKTVEDILAPYVEKENSTPENKIRFSCYVNRPSNERVCVFFTKELERCQDNKRYKEIDIRNTLKEALNDSSVLEYPVFRVTLHRNSKHVRNEPFVKGVAKVEEMESSSSESSSEGDED